VVEIGDAITIFRCAPNPLNALGLLDGRPVSRFLRYERKPTPHAATGEAPQRGQFRPGFGGNFNTRCPSAFVSVFRVRDPLVDPDIRARAFFGLPIWHASQPRQDEIIP